MRSLGRGQGARCWQLVPVIRHRLARCQHGAKGEGTTQNKPVFTLFCVHGRVGRQCVSCNCLQESGAVSGVRDTQRCSRTVHMQVKPAPQAVTQSFPLSSTITKTIPTIIEAK